MQTYKNIKAHLQNHKNLHIINIHDKLESRYTYILLRILSSYLIENF
jgi:hypothetical protein